VDPEHEAAFSNAVGSDEWVEAHQRGDEENRLRVRVMRTVRTFIQADKEVKDRKADKEAKAKVRKTAKERKADKEAKDKARRARKQVRDRARAAILRLPRNNPKLAWLIIEELVRGPGHKIEPRRKKRKLQPVVAVKDGSTEIIDPEL
jgi:hypothetical protein